MGYAGEAMNELHGTDVFTEDQRTTIHDGNIYKRDGDNLAIEVGGAKSYQREIEQRGQAIADAMGRYRGTEPLVDAVRRLSNDYHTAINGTDGVLREIRNELRSARATHTNMNGHHEGWAVILEEVDELWEVCKANTHTFLRERPKWAIGDIDLNDKESLRRLKRAAMRKEALQIAAMAMRFIEDVCDQG